MSERRPLLQRTKEKSSEFGNTNVAQRFEDVMDAVERLGAKFSKVSLGDEHVRSRSASSNTPLGSDERLPEHPVHTVKTKKYDLGVLFLHGYTSPGPSAAFWRRIFRSLSIRAYVETPTAPSGDARRDPFNEEGEPSWFRYSTDFTELSPRLVDEPNIEDVRRVVHGELLETVSRIRGVIGDRAPLLVMGESQGGVMASYLFATTLGPQLSPSQRRSCRIDGLGLLRSAPGPRAWLEAQRTERGLRTDAPTQNEAPDLMGKVVAITLAADDDVFDVPLVLWSASPLLVRHRCVGEVGALLRQKEELKPCISIKVLKGVTHYDGDEAIYREHAKHILRHRFVVAGL